MQSQFDSISSTFAFSARYLPVKLSDEIFFWETIRCQFSAEVKEENFSGLPSPNAYRIVLIHQEIFQFYPLHRPQEYSWNITQSEQEQ